MKPISAAVRERNTLSIKPPFASLLKQRPPTPAKAKLPGAHPPQASKPRVGVTSKESLAPTPTNATRQVFTTHQKTAEALTTSRTSAHQGAAHLHEARVAHHELVSERLDGRLLDLICKELVVEFTFEGAKPRVANQDLPLAPPTGAAMQSGVGVAQQSKAGLEGVRPVDASARAALAVALIEKIETFVKGSRVPSIVLTLNNSLGAKVEIERVGPRQVALTVVGNKGPPRAEDISRIREEMAARGLKVCTLSVA